MIYKGFNSHTFNPDLSSRRANAMDGAAEITRDSDALGKEPKVSDLFKNELTKKNWKVIDIASPAG